MQRMTAVVLAGGLLVAARAAAHNFVGAARCGTCHEFAYRVWASGPHAKAHEALSPDQLRDSKCGSCHTLHEDEQARWSGVQCERCHGAGKAYQAPYVMKDHDLAVALGMTETKPSDCQGCHTDGAPGVGAFDFKAMWARIDHGRAAREAWEKARKSGR